MKTQNDRAYRFHEGLFMNVSDYLGHATLRKQDIRLATLPVCDSWAGQVGSYYSIPDWTLTTINLISNENRNVRNRAQDLIAQ